MATTELYHAIAHAYQIYQTPFRRQDADCESPPTWQWRSLSTTWVKSPLDRSAEISPGDEWVRYKMANIDDQYMRVNILSISMYE